MKEALYISASEKWIKSLLFSFEYFSHLVHASVAIVKNEKSQSQQLLKWREEQRAEKGERKLRSKLSSLTLNENEKM